ncbi:MAG: STAS domain-containing protein [Limisphaerales bacterium]
MSKKTADIRVARLDDTVCIKLEGQANFGSSGTFKKVINDSGGVGAKRFIIDLSGCINMDSTFLGMLSGLGRNWSDKDTPPEERAIELLNPTERVADLIDNLGVSDLFRIVQAENLDNIDYCESIEAAPGSSKLELSKHCLEAHKILMEHNPENVAKFKDVAKYFEDEVKKESGEDDNDS